MSLKLRVIAAAATLAAAASATAEPYRIIVPLTPDDEGAMARLINYDTGASIDSVLVTEGAAVFTGDIDEPILARVVVDGTRMPGFVLESGTIARSKEGDFFGTMLNDQMRSFSQEMKTLAYAFSQAPTDGEKAEIYKKYNAALDSAIAENADNVLGLFYFLQSDASQLDAPGLREQLAKYPEFAKSQRVQGLLATAQKREATSVGQKFVDFEVTYDGKTSRLSDYVGKGNYTLVDFWASWCGPCIRQTAVLKDIYNKYKDKGLEVLGVAVWDKPEDTKRAIEQHELPWPCIIDAQTIPTDLYGISGIPCIILFGPDGTIISRDKQDDDLRADVDAAMSRK